jgi:hypothetical protein
MPVPFATRLALWQCCQAGLDSATLAHRYGLPARTVRRLLAQFRCSGQPFPPRYQGQPGPHAPADLVEQAVAYRKQHKDWGAGLIRIMLCRLKRWETVPHPRTIQRWLAQAEVAPAPAGRKSPYRPRSEVAHERWQIDAADQLRLGNGQLVSWLRSTDECSGAILKTVVFPLGVQPGAAGGRARGAA